MGIATAMAMNEDIPASVVADTRGLPPQRAALARYLAWRKSIADKAAMAAVELQNKFRVLLGAIPNGDANAPTLGSLIATMSLSAQLAFNNAGNSARAKEHEVRALMGAKVHTAILTALKP